MKATCEPSQEIDTYSINGTEVPLQTWLGTTDQGTRIELLVFAVIPARTKPLASENDGPKPFYFVEDDAHPALEWTTEQENKSDAGL